MNAQTPFSGRNERGSQSREWALQAGENEAERLDRYCVEMNRRDPRRHLWFVAKDDRGRVFVDSRPRVHGEWA